jgi:hypothetical protein
VPALQLRDSKRSQRKPSNARCSAQSLGSCAVSRFNFFALSCGGCLPLTIAVVISGASFGCRSGVPIQRRLTRIMTGYGTGQLCEQWSRVSLERGSSAPLAAPKIASPAETTIMIPNAFRQRPLDCGLCDPEIVSLKRRQRRCSYELRPSDSNSDGVVDRSGDDGLMGRNGTFEDLRTGGRGSTNGEAPLHRKSEKTITAASMHL